MEPLNNGHIGTRKFELLESYRLSFSSIESECLRHQSVSFVCQRSTAPVCYTQTPTQKPVHVIATDHHERVRQFIEDVLFVEHVAVVPLVVILIDLLFQGRRELPVASILLNLLQLQRDSRSPIFEERNRHFDS